MKRLILAALLAATPAAANQDEIDAIVLSNAEAVLWHEAAHMLIAELGLPVIGQEEDAADSFSTLMMMDQDVPDRVERVLDVAELWIVSHERDEAEGLAPAYYDSHDLDMQRGLRVLCFLAGEGPGRAHEMVTEWGLPRDRAETCHEDYVQAVESWDVLLAPHMRANPDVDPGEIISVRYGPGGGRWADLLRDEELLEFVADTLAYNFRLEPGLVLEAAECGEANAFWDPGTRTMTLCYELLRDSAELARIALATRD